MQKERRYPREKLDRNVMCFTEHESGGDIGRSYFFATLVNVSKDGAGLEMERDYASSDDVWLHGVDNLSECIPGKVVWTKKAAGACSLGLHFSAAH